MKRGVVINRGKSCRCKILIISVQFFIEKQNNSGATVLRNRSYFNFVVLKSIKMPYPEYICSPMRDELTAAGFEELKSPEQVDQTIANNHGTMLLVVNSVCGCAAGTAR